MPYTGHRTCQQTLVATYLSLQAHDILAGLILADVILDGAHTRGVGEGVGALINVVVSGRYIDKHERLCTASQ